MNLTEPSLVIHRDTGIAPRRIKLDSPLDETPRYFWLTEKIEIVAFLHEGMPRVFHSICPHMGARLDVKDGGKTLACPWHGLSFDLQSQKSAHHRYKKICQLTAQIDGDTLVIGEAR